MTVIRGMSGGRVRSRRYRGGGRARALCLALLALLAIAGPAAQAGASGSTADGPGQVATALARIGPGARVTDSHGGIALRMSLSQGVPWRVFVLADPWRLVLDFATVDWAGFDAAGLDRSGQVSAVHTGTMRPGWSRMVLDLDRPMRLGEAALDTGGRGGAAGSAMLKVDLDTAPEAEARTAAGAPPSALFSLPHAIAASHAEPAPALGPGSATAPTKHRQLGDRPLVVMLDPGHGGIDPGAHRDGVDEKDITLKFALELRDVLRRAGMTARLTRDDDRFVPLEERISLAHAAGADLFLSIHADAIAEGQASGATVYTLARNASDRASRQLAERHDRDDLLAGLDLSRQDDVVAGVLMDLARTETGPRSARLARDLVERLGEVGPMHRQRRLQADFSVLKAPDIPSALIEIGFLSSPEDRARLEDPDWRARAEGAIRDAVAVWARADAAEARLIRH